MARFDKYNFPQAGEIFSNGKIGRMEHLIVKIGKPVTGGSMAIIGALKHFKRRERRQHVMNKMT